MYATVFLHLDGTGRFSPSYPWASAKGSLEWHAITLETFFFLSPGPSSPARKADDIYGGEFTINLGLRSPGIAVWTTRGPFSSPRLLESGTHLAANKLEIDGMRYISGNLPLLSLFIYFKIPAFITL
jgi:hypothetical protein